MPSSVYMFGSSGIQDAKGGDLLDPHVVPNDVRRSVHGLIPTGKSMAWQFEPNGLCSFRQVSRAELFKMIQVASSSGGAPRQRSTRRSFLATIPAIQMRDIRQLDQAYAESQEPTIIVREQSILVNVDAIRAVVLRHACIVFDGPKDTIALLKAKFREYMGDNMNVPFELSAFEVLLSTLTAGYSKSFEALRPAAEATLHQVAKIERPRGEFEQLRAIQTSLAVLECNVVSVRQLLMSLLDNDDELHMLYLTKMHENPTLLTEGELTFDVDEAVSMLEVHLHDIYGILSRISLMVSNIQHTARVVDLMWTSKRNYLLLIDMSLRVMLLLMFCTNYWTGVFGQNLKSGIEENEGLFWGTSLVYAVWTFAAYGVVCKVFLARGLSLSWRKRV